MLSVAHIIPYFGRAQGGPVISVANMTEALVEKFCRVSLITSGRRADGQLVPHGLQVELRNFTRSRVGMFRWNPELGQFLLRQPFDILHSHCLWMYPGYAASCASQRQRTPHVIAPCGMLQNGALRRFSWKKRIYRLFFQDRILRKAACLHVKSKTECADIRRLGFRNPVAIIPNPIPGPGSLVSPLSFEQLCGRFPVFKEKRTILFLGLLYSVKGIERLLVAWEQLALFHDDWNLVLAGPDVEGYQAKLKSQADPENVRNSVHFTGILDERWKWAALQACDLFVMPSYFENFGSSIAEAMTAGKPVIATTGTPWEILRERNAGWWVNRDSKTLLNTLREGMMLPDNEREQMGRRGQEIASEFTPESVGAKLFELYNWLLGKSDQPDFVSH